MRVIAKVSVKTEMPRFRAAFFSALEIIIGLG
jgi:hypothetical protein